MNGTILNVFERGRQHNSSCCCLFRETSKRKKGKQIQDRKLQKIANEGSNLNTGLFELDDGTTPSTLGNTNAKTIEVELPLLPQDDPEMDPIRSIDGTASVCLPRDGECTTFRGAVSIRIEDWEGHQPVCDTVVTVYSSGVDEELCVRAVVYYTKLGAYAEVSIKGFDDLRQVVGALNQSLAHQWRCQPKDVGTAEALFKFIFHERAIIMLGKWDGDRDEYVEHGTDFTVLLKRSRLYRSFKQTPVHLSGEQDTQANTHHLIDDASRRGKKVFRQAINISNTLLQITGYELPPPEASQDGAPTLRFIAYDPKTQVQLVAVIQPDAVLELGGGPYSPWMARDKRDILAGIIAQSLRLKARIDGSPTLVMPWSGENLALVDEVQPGETSRPRSDKVLRFANRKGLSKLEAFSTRITNFEVVITVFGKTDALSLLPAVAAQDEDADDTEKPTLIFNLYCPKLSESVDIELPHDMQKMMTGWNIHDIPKGEARSSAIRRAARYICVTLPPTSTRLQAEFLFNAQKPWLVAYNELDISDRPSARRPRGQPLIFVPAVTDGDLITSKVITIGGLKVLLRVYTKARGRPGRDGLVFEMYNQETCATATLHLSSHHLLQQVDEKAHLLEDGRLLGTILLMTKRLLLRKSATGGWDLWMDRNLEPLLFMGM